MNPAAPPGTSEKPRLEATSGAAAAPAAVEREAGPPARTAVSQWSHLVAQWHAMRSGVRILVLLSLDALLVTTIFFAVGYARDHDVVPGGAMLREAVPPGVVPSAEALIAVLLGLVLLGNYGPADARRDPARLLAGASLGVLLPYWALLWERFTPLELLGLGGMSLLVGGVLIAERRWLDTSVVPWWPVGRGIARTLVIGTDEDLLRVSTHQALVERRTFNLCGRVDLRTVQAGHNGRIADAVARAIARHRANTLLLVAPLDDEAFGDVVDAATATGCQMYALSRSLQSRLVEPKVVWERGAPLVQLTRPGLRGQHLLMKRAMDVTLSTVGLLLLAPLLLVLAVAIKLTSPGPVLFRQRRVGLGGKTFEMIKFRSMVSDAEAQRDGLLEQSLYRDPRLFKVAHDPRVTPLGRFLRRSSLDELPQLWNVLRGDMSLVGPRPPLPAEVALYEEHHYARFEVKPGITGPWQVSGRNRLTDFEEIIALETAYIREWNVWKDLSILLRTVPVVLSGRGAH